MRGRRARLEQAQVHASAGAHVLAHGTEGTGGTETDVEADRECAECLQFADDPDGFALVTHVITRAKRANGQPARPVPHTHTYSSGQRPGKERGDAQGRGFTLVAESRTLKLMHGIVRGCWVVNADWVSESLRQGRLVDERAYELSCTSHDYNAGGTGGDSGIDRVSETDNP